MKKAIKALLIFIPLFATGHFIVPVLAQAPAPVAHGVQNDLPRPYQTQRDWGELPPGMEWAAVTAVEPSPDGQFIYVVASLSGQFLRWAQ